MQYYKPITDSSGYIHSIDNVIIIFFLKRYQMENVANELKAIREYHHADGWEKLNLPHCSKYSFFQNVVHIGAMHILYGKYQKFDKMNREWDILPMLRFEVNPNKHYDEPVFRDILVWLHQNCTDGILQRFDYAIDVPCDISQVRIYGSRKEPGLYKGTVYRGQRSHHGFTKIYDKAKEQNLDKPLTRVEYVLEADKPPSFEKIMILPPISEKETDTNELDAVNACIVDMALALQLYGEDYEPYLQKLNYRRRKKIEPYLLGKSTELAYPPEILDCLKEQIKELFLISENDNTILPEYVAPVEVKQNDFIPLDDIDLEDLPFT